eukprot:9266115-Pyramimonas_sp.AAC.1
MDLRLARRRSHAALQAVLAHGKDKATREIAIAVGTSRWFEEADAKELARLWKGDLDDLRETIPEKFARKPPRKRK